MHRPLSRGFVDVARRTEQFVHLEGWLAGFGPEPIEAITVAIGGGPAVSCADDLHLPSPDIGQGFPHLFGAEHCRFRVRLPGRHAPDRLVAVTPVLAGGQEGCSVYGLLEPTLPPPEPQDVDFVGGDSRAALEYLGYFVGLGGLTPTARVLDVGCGVGRMAHPLTYYLTARGSYAGFDVVAHGIGQARAKIGARCPRFRFDHVDVRNEMYNPGGALRADAFRFPYADHAFDFAFLTSVFTHMQGTEVRHYLDELVRVLAPGATCLLTCFLLNDEAQALVSAGKSSQPLHVPLDDCLAADGAVPERAIGFAERLFRGWLAERGLVLVRAALGSWCGRKGALSYQDVLVVRREVTPRPPGSRSP